MSHYLAVAFGGAFGAMARFWVYNSLLKATGDKFPLSTFVVNVVGSLLIGCCFVLITEKTGLRPEWRSVLVVGFLGAFTTFSTFSLDAYSLLQQGQVALALAYIFASVLVCLLAVWVGLTLTRMII